MLVRFAETGLSGSGPHCGRCASKPFMSCQTFESIEVDRCLECFGMWLDGGELEALGGGHDRDSSTGHCLMCARPTHRDQSSGARTALCPSCMQGSPLAVDRATSHSFGMGADSGDRTTTTTIQGGRVRFFYDQEEEGTLFCWDGELANNEVRGTVSYENLVTRLFRRAGFVDLELEDEAFDNQFKVVSSTPEQTLDWLRGPGVREGLETIARETGGVVSISHDQLRILGEQSLESPVPNPPLEEACKALYLSLRNS